MINLKFTNLMKYDQKKWIFQILDINCFQSLSFLTLDYYFNLGISCNMK